MFRALSAHLQEDTVVYMQHMVLSLFMRVPGGLSVHSFCVPTGHQERIFYEEMIFSVSSS